MICNTCGIDRRVWGCRCEEVHQIADLRSALAAERTAKCKAERERDEARAEAQAKDPAIHARKELTLQLQKRMADATVARDALWQHYRRCTDALGLRFDQVPENPEKELEMWRGMRAKVAELERDRERLDWVLKHCWVLTLEPHSTPVTSRDEIDAAREAKG